MYVICIRLPGNLDRMYIGLFCNLWNDLRGCGRGLGGGFARKTAFAAPKPRHVRFALPLPAAVSMHNSWQRGFYRETNGRGVGGWGIGEVSVTWDAG